MIRNFYGVLTPLIFFYIMFNGFIVALSITSVLHYYVFLVIVIFVLGAFLLNKTDTFKVDFSLLKNIKFFNKLFSTSVLVVTLFILINKNNLIDILNFKSLLINKYDLRVNGVDVPMYTIFFQSFATILLVLSIVYLVLRDWIRYSISTILYALFYMYSIQTSPIAVMIIVHGLVYIQIFNVNYKKVLLILIFSSLCLFFYVYFTVYGTNSGFHIEKFTVIINAIYKRVTLAGELVLGVYDYFSEHNFLNGSTFPIFFGLIDLNLFEPDRTRLPSLMMKLYYGQDYGGANTSFITDGFANFGYGVDILMIIIAFLWTFLMINLAKVFLNKSFLQIYKLIVMIMIIDLVHVQFWGYLESLVFFMILLILMNVIERIRIGKKSVISSVK